MDIIALGRLTEGKKTQGDRDQKVNTAVLNPHGKIFPSATHVNDWSWLSSLGSGVHFISNVRNKNYKLSALGFYCLQETYIQYMFLLKKIRIIW